MVRILINPRLIIRARTVDSLFLWAISTKDISGSAKTLILMKFDNSGKISNASACGDSCAKWIVDIARDKELTINLHHLMNFSACDDFEVFIINIGKQVKDYDEDLEEAFRIGSK